MTKVVVVVMSLGFIFAPANITLEERVAHSAPYEQEAVFSSTASVGMLP